MFFKSKPIPHTDSILKVLSTIEDPDLHKDIVSLGFIQGLKISNDGDISFKLVLTTPACPVKDELKAECEKRLKTLSGVRDVHVEVSSQVPQSAPGSNRMTIPGVRQMVAIASGKGGVGKSTVTLNLAVALAHTGAKVGVLDADIYGPSVPHMLGISTKPEVKEDRIFPIETPWGVKAISMGFFIPIDQAVVWRGPMVHSALTQFMNQVEWGDLDYLLVDMPPGTGDAQLTMSQVAPLSGAVIVTTPQEISLLDARRGLLMFKQVGVPILGVIENFSGYICPNCKVETPIFLKGGGEKISKELGVPLLGAIALDPKICELADRGIPIVAEDPAHPVSLVYGGLAQKIAAQISTSVFSAQFKPLELQWR